MIRLRQLLFLLAGWLCSTWSGQTQAKTFLYVSLAAEDGIAIYQVNDDNGKLKYVGRHDLGTDPGPISVSPDRRTLYVSLRNAGKLTSLRIAAEDGSLKHLSTVTVEPDPAYHWPETGRQFFLTAYYRTGKVSVHRLAPNGAILADKPRWYVTARNAHGIAVDKQNRHVYVTHTGANAIYQFQLDPAVGTLQPARPAVIRTPEKSGPRHIALHPRKPFAYADNEQGNSITFYRIVAGSLQAAQTLSTVPDDWDQGGACARLEMSADGAHVYVANRGHNSIATFQIDPQTGRLRALGQTATEANPRSFTIHENGRFLYAGGQDTDRLAIFARAGNGRLSRIDTVATGKRPWWLQLVTIR